MAAFIVYISRRFWFIACASPGNDLLILQKSSLAVIDTRRGFSHLDDRFALLPLSLLVFPADVNILLKTLVFPHLYCKVMYGLNFFARSELIPEQQLHWLAVHQ